MDLAQDIKGRGKIGYWEARSKEKMAQLIVPPKPRQKQWRTALKIFKGVVLRCFP